MSAAGFDLCLLVGGTSHRLQGLGIHTPPTQEGSRKLNPLLAGQHTKKASTAGNVFTNPGSGTPEAQKGLTVLTPYIPVSLARTLKAIALISFGVICSKVNLLRF